MAVWKNVIQRILGFRDFFELDRYTSPEFFSQKCTEDLAWVKVEAKRKVNRTFLGNLARYFVASNIKCVYILSAIISVLLNQIRTIRTIKSNLMWI